MLQHLLHLLQHDQSNIKAQHHTPYIVDPWRFAVSCRAARSPLHPQSPALTTFCDCNACIIIACRQQQHVQPCRAASEQQTATTSAAGQELVPDSEFSITKISYGSILTPVGLGLMVYGFGAYFTLLPGTDISSVLLIYGFPMSILGFALSYAQLEPVPCKTTRAAFDLRDSQMTDIQKQIRDDTTRYRCGFM
jgi:hypothetical protein